MEEKEKKKKRKSEYEVYEKILEMKNGFNGWALAASDILNKLVLKGIIKKSLQVGIEITFEILILKKDLEVIED